MRTQFNFKFGNASANFTDINEIDYREQEVPILRTQGKPVKLFYTHGMQVIGVPDELISILGAQAIRRANGAKLITSAHFETANAFYLLRIEALAHMAFPPAGQR